jgi:hypothetical protein
MTHSEQQVKREQWKKLVEEYEKSTLSQIDFCKHNNLSPAKFSYYKNQYKTKPKIEGAFSPVKISQAVNTAEIRLILPNGFQCFFLCNMDKAQIKNLMEVLLTC